MKEKESKARVAVCILLIAWNPSGESETLPSDQPPASLTLSLRRRRRRRRTARELHISLTKQYVTYSVSTVQRRRHIWTNEGTAFCLKYLLSGGFLS